MKANFKRFESQMISSIHITAAIVAQQLHLSRALSIDPALNHPLIALLLRSTLRFDRIRPANMLLTSIETGVGQQHFRKQISADWKTKKKF